MTVYVCFEGQVPSEHAATATEFYTTLKELVVRQPGFISETPFESIDQEGGQVLYVKFDNEEHLHAWKNLHVHLRIQAVGRAKIFSDYRLRIGKEASEDENTSGDNTTSSVGKYLLMWQYPAQPSATGTDLTQKDIAPDLEPSVWRNLVDAATYVSKTHVLRISSWSNKTEAIKVRDAVRGVNSDNLRLIQVERDYGKYQRKEAPEDATRCQNAAADNDEETLKTC